MFYIKTFPKENFWASCYKLKPRGRAPENIKLAGNWPKVAAMCGLQNYKLDGVGPVDNRPSTNKLHHFVR